MQCFFFRFMDSELELHDEIQKLHVLATAPEFYHIIVKLNAVNSLLGLLNHENTGKCFTAFKRIYVHR